MNKEKDFHKRIQALRNDFAEYLNAGKEDVVDFGKFGNFKTCINDKFVELLILNELIHKVE